MPEELCSVTRNRPLTSKILLEKEKYLVLGLSLMRKPAPQISSELLLEAQGSMSEGERRHFK